MPLKEVIEEITNQANREASEILKKAEAESKEILKKAELGSEQKTAEARENASKAAEEYKKKKIANIKLDLKKERMQEKKAILEQIVNKAKEKLGKMDERQREDLLKKLITIAKHELPDIKYIECSKSDANIVKKMMQTAEIKSDLAGLGGIIAANKDKTIQLDLTFERLLEQAKEEYIDEISKRVFRQDA
ncbi:MAG: hypothetical protein COT15_01085 [Candidatus Diapherotrites archaeon CG08_land_8_20_14_0_20_34_12]|nr:MAG: hypothetical protein COT15_01085 [Candidatus Diapherotrites archaeon CG08_land_8_20_14_0_20_34_12]